MHILSTANLFKFPFGLTVIGCDQYLPESDPSLSTLFIHGNPRFQYHHGESSQLESWDRFRDDVFGRSLGRIPVCRGVDDAKVVTTGPYVNSGRSKRDSEVAFRGIWILS